MKEGNQTIRNIVLTIIICVIFALIFACVKTDRPIEADHYAQSDISASQKAFGAWVNDDKYLSVDDLKKNMADSSMLFFASSEINHIKETLYHPSHIFAPTDINIMCIGTAYNQCLSMATYLGAMEKATKNKKITLVLSAAWFYKKGCTPKDYTKRFSEDAYIEFMESDRVTRKQKIYLAKRTNEMMLDEKMLQRVKVYNRAYINKNASPTDLRYIESRKEYIKKANHKKLMKAYKSDGINLIEDVPFVYNPTYVPNWNELVSTAINHDKNYRNNKYYIDDTRWAEKYQVQMPGLKGGQVNSSFETSPEYDDLRLFLDICKENGQEVILICQPQNGYWYDDTGLKAESRKVFPEKIKKVAKDYDATVATYGEYEYEKYFCLDPLHLAGEGWTRICKDIYEFYKQ